MSNKTQKSSDEKTESAPKTNIPLLIFLAVAVMLLSAMAFTMLSDRRIMLGSQRLDVTVVDTPDERAKGLSNRSRLGEDQGMLFVFSDSSAYCFWMKDMKFPIDIIWLDKDKKVVHIQEGAIPDSYPESYCPDTDAQYVLEVNAGMAQKWGIKEGSQAKF